MYDEAATRDGGAAPTEPLARLAARGWTVRLFAAPAEGLGDGDLDAAARAFRAALAGPVPGPHPVEGFGTLRRATPCEGPPGALVLAAHWWGEGETLHRAALLLPGDGGPPWRLPGAASGAVARGTAEVALLARECAARIAASPDDRP